MGTMVRNYWTTIIGVVGGLGTYFSTAGAKVPETKSDWVMLWIGAVMAALGIASKDATTSSAPK